MLLLFQRLASRRCKLCVPLQRNVLAILLLVTFMLYYSFILMSDDGTKRFSRIHTRNISEYVMPNEFTTLVDQHNICQSNALFLIAVTSAPKNFKAREAIRETWGKEAISHADTRLLFFLGLNDEAKVKEKVKTEAEEHQDIIVENFVDSYLNLTIKTVFMLKWASRTCPKLNYVLKTDDDMFINIKAMRKRLSFTGASKSEIRGFLHDRVKPIRDPKSKWFLPSHFYSEQTYPPFLSGTAYILSGNIVDLLYKTSLKTPMVPLEDVFLTGLVAFQKLGIHLKHEPGFRINRPFFDHPCNYLPLVTVHELSPSRIKDVWKSINGSDLNCNSLTNKLIVWISSFF